MGRRALDLLVTLAAMALCAWPFLPAGNAASSSSVYDIPIVVDQEVREAGMITKPINGRFDAGNSGRSTGSIEWAVTTTASEGYKLVVSTDRSPAFRDGSTMVSDYSAKLAGWDVPANQNRFGFSARGTDAMGGFAEGTRWRGFAGVLPIEVARNRGGPAATTPTWVILSSEINSGLPAGADPEVFVRATAMVNL